MGGKGASGANGGAGVGVGVELVAVAPDSEGEEEEEERRRERAEFWRTPRLPNERHSTICSSSASSPPSPPPPPAWLWANLSASNAPNSRQSCFRDSTASEGELKSTTKARTCARSMCLRKSRPSPRSRWASGTSPGISAKEIVVRGSPSERVAGSTGLPRLLSSTTVPIFGWRVVNAQSPMRARLLLRARKSVDFPAFGIPTKPTSARILSSSSSMMDKPGSPLVATRGFVLSRVTKCGFPRPPMAPAARSMGASIGSERSRWMGAVGWDMARLDCRFVGKGGKSVVAKSEGMADG